MSLRTFLKRNIPQNFHAMVSIMFLTIKYAINAKFFMRIRLEAALQISDFMKSARILKIFLNVISDENISLLVNLNRNN